MHAQAMELGPSESSRERGDASGDSACTGDAKAATAGGARQGQQQEEGDSVSGAELLTAVDPKLGTSDTSVLKCAPWPAFAAVSRTPRLLAHASSGFSMPAYLLPP